MLLDQRKEVSKLRKKLKGTQGYRETKVLVGIQRLRLEKLQRLKAKSVRISTRINQMQPSGWKEFLQVSNPTPSLSQAQNDHDWNEVSHAAGHCLA